MAQHVHPQRGAVSADGYSQKGAVSLLGQEEGEKSVLTLDSTLLGSCRRAIVHAALGHEAQKTSEKHTFALDAERALREVALSSLERRGWELQTAPVRQAARDPFPEIRVTGSPDALGRGEGEGGEDSRFAQVSVRVDWLRREDNRDRVAGESGNRAHTLHAAFCHVNSPLEEVREQPALECVVAAEPPGGKARRVQPGESAELEQEAMERLRTLAEWVRKGPGGELPERDFEKDSAECWTCPFFSPCRTRREQ